MKILKVEDHSYSIMYVNDNEKYNVYKRVAENKWEVFHRNQWKPVINNIMSLDQMFREFYKKPTNMNKFRTDRPSMKKRLVLLNSEGNILTAVKENGEFKLIDEFKQHIATLNAKEMFKFTRGQITIYNSQEEEMNYTKYSGGMKPNLKELDEFIGVDTTGLSY